MLALSFNVRKDIIYFSENKTKTISRVRMVAGEGPDIIIGGIGTVEGKHVVHPCMPTCSSQCFKSITFM